MSTILEIKWNGKRFPIEFRNTKELEQTSVKDLKSICQRITGVDVRNIKINAFGALMNNDDMPLSVYGLRPGCFVTMKVLKTNEHVDKAATKEEPQHKKHNHHHHHHQPKNMTSNNHHRRNKDNNQQFQKATEEASSEEAQLLDKLQQIRSKVDTEIASQVKKYEKDVKEFVNSSQPTEKEKKRHFYMGAYLGEQLMHIFFDLDAFTCGPNNPNARHARKEAVNMTQGLLDKVDEIKSVVKSIEVEEDES